jgi:isoleucyl-tRNA synthetase
VTVVTPATVALPPLRASLARLDQLPPAPAQVHRKLRNSCRFMLGNLHDYNPSTDAPPTSALRSIDRQVLAAVAAFTDRAHGHYERLDTTRLVADALQLASVELSAGYFDSVRDRLYCAPADSPSRRAAQFVLAHALDTLSLAIAPVLPFLVEELHVHRHAASTAASPGAPASPGPFQRVWSDPPVEWRDEALSRRWRLVCAARDEAARLAHEVVLAKRLPSTGEVRVEMLVTPAGPLHAALLSAGSELNDVLLCCASRVLPLPAEADLGTPAPAAGLVLAQAVVPPGGSVGEETFCVRIYAPDDHVRKCARCWRHVHERALSGEGVTLEDGWPYRGCPSNGAAGMCAASQLE